MKFNLTPVASASGVSDLIKTNGRFTLMSAADVALLPRPTWLVDDILPSTGLGCLFGPSGVGKSFLCLGLAASVAAGLDWFGYKTQQRPVVYIALESKSAFALHNKAWEIQHGMSFPTDVNFIFDPFSLVSNDDTASLSNLINSTTGAGLIIIDTLSRSAPGKDENSSIDMSKLIAQAAVLQAATGSLIVFVHHTGKDAGRGLRGHSILYAAFDAVVEVVPDGERILWTLLKSRDSQDGVTKAFELSVINLGADDTGKELTSCAVTEVERGQINLSKKEPKGANQKLVLAAFQAVLLEDQMLCAATGRERPDGFTIDEAIAILKDKLISVDTKHRQSRVKEALERLVEMGYLRLTDDVLSLPIHASEQGDTR